MTAVTICNRALAAIGEAPNITAISPPAGSAHAQLCALLYLPAVEFVTESRHWTFCDRRATLAKPRIAVTSFDPAGDNVYTSVAHGLEWNDQVTLRKVSLGGSAPGGLTDETTYYVIEGSSTSVRLKTDGSDYSTATLVDITSAGSGTWVLERESDRAGSDYQYALPTDCLTERSLVPQGAPDDWPGTQGMLMGTPYAGIGVVASSRDGLNYSVDSGGFGGTRALPCKRAVNKAGEQVIYTNLENAELVYSAFITDVAQWPPMFKQAVVFQLAAELAGPIKRDPKIVDWCLSRAQAFISEAARIDGQRVVERQSQRYPWSR